MQKILWISQKKRARGDNFALCQTLKADRLHLRNYLQTPTDYRQQLFFALCCTRQSRIDCCAPEIWPWPVTWTLPSTFYLDLKAMYQCSTVVKTWFWAFDIDLWPTALTYNPNLAKVKVNLHNEYQGRRSSSSARRMDGRMDGRYHLFTLSPCFAMLHGWY